MLFIYDRQRNLGRFPSMMCQTSAKRWLARDIACQAHAAEYKDRRVGSLGDLACFSFYPGKNLGAYGEGGIVLTNDAEQARTLRMLRDWGQDRRYHHTLQGFNYRMEGLQGAVLRVKLRHLARWTDLRRERAAMYGQLLAEGVTIPPEMPYARHVHHIYAIRSENREDRKCVV